MKDEPSRLQDYWRDEVEAASTYERLAEAATDSQTRDLLLEMRDAERRHAARWEARIREPGGELPPPPSGWRARWLGLLARLGGLEAVLVSAGLSIAALFVIGLLKTLFTDLSWLRSGLEMVIIGLFATVITYLIGTLFGVQLS